MAANTGVRTHHRLQELLKRLLGISLRRTQAFRCACHVTDANFLQPGLDFTGKEVITGLLWKTSAQVCQFLDRSRLLAVLKHKGALTEQRPTEGLDALEAIFR